jgi:hypothetical protein
MFNDPREHQAGGMKKTESAFSFSTLQNKKWNESYGREIEIGMGRKDGRIADRTTYK